MFDSFHRFHEIHSVYDLLIVPLYLTLTYIFANNYVVSIEQDSSLRKWIRLSFLAKNFIAIIFIAFGWIQYKYLMDTGSYFLLVKKAAHLINTRTDVSFLDIFYNPIKFSSVMGTEDIWKNPTNTFPFLILPFYYAGFGSIFGMIFTINFLVFICSCKFYEMVKYLFPEYKKEAVIAIFLLPTVVLWAGGIYKDTFAFMAMLLIVYSVWQFFIHGNIRLKYIIIIVVSTYLISITKSHVLALYGFIGFWVIKANTHKLSNELRVIVYIFCFAILGFGSKIALDSLSTSGLDVAKFADVKNVTGIIKSYNSFFKGNADLAGSTYDIGTFEPTINGIIKLIPAGFVVTFFRPFLWEFKSVVLIFNLIESFILLVMSVYIIIKMRFRVFRFIFKDGFLTFCLLYSFFLGAMIGITSFNFGSLARYKTPVMPFFAFLVLVLFKEALKLNKKKIDIALK